MLLPDGSKTVFCLASHVTPASDEEEPDPVHLCMRFSHDDGSHECSFCDEEWRADDSD